MQTLRSLRSVVWFEALGAEVTVYEPIRAAVQVEAEASVQAESEIVGIAANRRERRAVRVDP